MLVRSSPSGMPWGNRAHGRRRSQSCRTSGLRGAPRTRGAEGCSRYTLTCAEVTALCAVGSPTRSQAGAERKATNPVREGAQRSQEHRRLEFPRPGIVTGDPGPPNLAGRERNHAILITQIDRIRAYREQLALQLPVRRRPHLHPATECAGLVLLGGGQPSAGRGQGGTPAEQCDGQGEAHQVTARHTGSSRRRPPSNLPPACRPEPGPAGSASAGGSAIASRAGLSSWSHSSRIHSR